MIADSIIGVIDKLWPMLAIFVVVIVIVRIAYLKINNEKFVFYKEVMALIFIIYLYLLFELVTNRDIGNGGINLVPFREIFRYDLSSSQFILNVIGNIAVFIPFGYFVSTYIKSKKIFPVLLISIITSLTIELVQLQIGRAFDIDDIILNVLGGIIGWLLYISFTAVKSHLPKILQKDFIYNILTFILVIVGVLYLIKIMGFSFGW